MSIQFSFAVLELTYTVKRIGRVIPLFWFDFMIQIKPGLIVRRGFSTSEIDDNDIIPYFSCKHKFVELQMGVISFS